MPNQCGVIPEVSEDAPQLLSLLDCPHRERLLSLHVNPFSRDDGVRIGRGFGDLDAGQLCVFLAAGLEDEQFGVAGQCQEARAGVDNGPETASTARG